jgi:hypothetical protein
VSEDRPPVSHEPLAAGDGAACAAAHGAAHNSPPSAAGYLDPYSVRITIEPTSRALEPEKFLTALLEDLAAGCLASGASVIGHLKCLLHTPTGVLACNLTSIRSGAACAAPAGGAEAAAPLEQGESACLDLAVLVYGLPVDTVDALLRRVLVSLLEPSGVAWCLTAGAERG